MVNGLTVNGIKQLVYLSTNYFSCLPQQEIRVNPLYPWSLNKRKQKKEAAASFNYYALAIS